MEKLIKKIAALFQKPEENPSVDAVMEARQEVAIAWNKFNEATMDEYIDIAIMNLNLAKKRLDVAIKESKEAVGTHS
ncbi:MAG: hypothetical protein E7413_05450 [Ruminococcaceae bacterium]|nr:hypothetical protein [Oscillospiraceae bacterium]